MEKGLVSIVLLAYNHEKYICQAVESIAGQSYQNFEVILIDDGSKDDTLAKGKSLLEELKIRHTAVAAKDNWICKNLNIAIKEHLKGEFFSVLSADDWWPPENLKNKVRYLTEHPTVPLVYSGMTFYQEDTSEYQDCHKKCFSGNVYHQLLLDNFMPAHAVVLRLEIFKEVGTYDEASKIEDWDMWLRIAQKYEVGFIPDCRVFHRRHQTNLSSNSRLMIDSGLYILSKHCADSVGREQYLKTLMFVCANRAEIAKTWRAAAEYGRFDMYSFRQVIKSFLIKAGLVNCATCVL